MKMISWNVNGFRALQRKMDVYQWMSDQAIDALMIQETKLQASQIEFQTPDYFQYWNHAVRKGYSGTAIFVNNEPIRVQYGMDDPRYDQEGRLITLEYPAYYLVNCYTPNSQRDLARLDFRLGWGTAFTHYIQELDKQKPVILCGDLNVAHQAIDLRNPKANEKNSGFTIEERQDFSHLLAQGFVDSFRRLHPQTSGAYSWWSYRLNARARNIGWRIDYFVVSERLAGRIEHADILSEVSGSDHCPIMLAIDPA
ncbi:MAG: exodeoxyribonuclease III [Sporolactobacillus sp.]